LKRNDRPEVGLAFRRTRGQHRDPFVRQNGAAIAFLQGGVAQFEMKRANPAKEFTRGNGPISAILFCENRIGFVLRDRVAE
jgi:hypothetical protein